MISIIIPVYNVENYLCECFQSIVSQEYKDFEIIFVNDGSTDSSLDKCLNFKQQNPEISIIIINKLNEGVTAARRDGVFASHGEWIMFMDADDILESNALKILVSNISHNINVIIGSHSLLIDGKKEFKANRSIGLVDHSEYIDLFLKSKVEGAPWAKLFRKEVFSLEIFDLPRDITVKEDVIMNFRIACSQNRNVLFINEPLYIYRWLRPNSAVYHAKTKGKDISYEIRVLNYIGSSLKTYALYETKESLLAYFYFTHICSWKYSIVKQPKNVIGQIEDLLSFVKKEKPLNFSYLKYLYLFTVCKYTSLFGRN